MISRKIYFLICAFIITTDALVAQHEWTNVDSLFNLQPPSVQVFYTNDSLEGRPNIALYLKARLDDPSLVFDVDTAYRRGLTPDQYFVRNDSPLVVVNCTFFSGAKLNLNVVIDDGEMVSFNLPSVYSRSDSSYHYVTRSAIGIDRRHKADVAYIYTDSLEKKAYKIRKPLTASGTGYHLSRKQLKRMVSMPVKRWRTITAVGGGPNLISNGKINITNEEERMFTGKAVNDRHPRTAMGYTSDGYLIILVVEGRNRGVAEGATLRQEAEILLDLGCVEALNLDGGGSSCMLINGKETVRPSDINGQRAVPAVFIIKKIR